MCTRTRRWAKARKILVSVLPFSHRIIDMVFGALPGKLAEQFARLAQDWITRNQRLVIYQMDGVNEQLIAGRLDAYCRTRAASYEKSNSK